MFVRSLAVIATLLWSGGNAIAFTETRGMPNSMSPLSLQWAHRNQRAQRQPRPDRANWLRELNLTAEQIQKIQDIRQQYQARLTEQRQAVRQAQQELKQLMASNASTARIREKFDQMQTLKQKLGDTRMESMLAIRNVLNPEQRQKLNDIIRQRGRDRLDNW
ncbi:MAG: Spy/CpxP family protein refolding chaperone [Leptolyngbyaceae cyanobacterium bins.349]|nr:Spy/CpxP family protein refolding chaperone [Leptolyngbyaceae cyanobacterium bins.349]